MPQVIDAINAAAPEMAGKITFESAPLGIPPGIDDSALVERLGPMQWTPLAQGVRETIEVFRSAAKQGKVNVDKILA